MLENAVQCVGGNEHVKVTITAMEKDHFKIAVESSPQRKSVLDKDKFTMLIGLLTH